VVAEALPPAGALDRPQPRRLVLLLGALAAFAPLSLDMYLPGLPELSDDLGAGASATQLTLTACLLGLAMGQLLLGPVSDARGRRAPLLAGLVAYAAASIACAAAPSIATLVVLRFAQGFAGAAGIVIARAIVRDVSSGAAAARLFSTLILVTNIAPIVAPIAGGQLLAVTDWRGVFVVLALIGGGLLVATLAMVDETLPEHERGASSLRATLATFGMLLRQRAFVGCTLSCGLAFAAMFAYIAGSPFVLQDVYGMSATEFSFAFALNAVGILGAGTLSRRLAGTVAPERLLGAGLAIGATGGGALLLVVATDVVGLAGVLPALFCVVASMGLVIPSATTLALAGARSVAGSASGLLGLAQFAFGAAAAPLVGLAGEDTALPMAIVIAALGAGAVTAFLTLVRPAPIPAG
jgi:DHA1 family bicyclomycin/chloramphenicol resistance-like MFS transporter